jgi:hypothetical protein
MKKTLLLILISMVLCAGVAFSQGVPVVGEWIVGTDIENSGDSTITMTQTTRDGMPAYRFTGNVTTKYQYGFVQWEIQPNADSLAALRTGKGVSFKILGDGKRYTIKVRMPFSRITDYAYHEFNFNTRAGEVMTIEVPMRMFMQPSWGKAVTMNQRSLETISWQTHEAWRPGTFDVTVWDVRIMQ